MKGISTQIEPMHGVRIIRPVDEDVERFLVTNSDCCKVYKELEMSRIEKWLSRYPISIRIAYERREVSHDTGKPVFYEAYWEMTECGKTGERIAGSIERL